jgi:opacity protein-like surface antigen
MKPAAVLLVLLAAAPVAAQTPEPLPWFAVDLHAATVGLPQAEGWVPEVSGDTVLPGRNWGVSAGATAYPFRLGLITFGFGASLISGKGSGESLTITEGSGSTATTRITPVVHTGITSLVPQLSINFGRKPGWSYLSAGLGLSKVTSRADAVGTTPAIVVPEAWNSALNFGGGARWFMKPHLGAGFDVRFVKLGSRSATATLPAAKRTQVWTISAGITMQ